MALVADSSRRDSQSSENSTKKGAEGRYEKFVIALDGDIILEPILTGTRIYQPPLGLLVSAEAMGHGSPVFKAMLLGPFSEASRVSKGSPSCVSLPEDHPEALTLLAKIFHDDTDHLPDTVDLGLLYAFAGLVHKYLCADRVRGWSKLWTKSFMVCEEGKAAIDHCSGFSHDAGRLLYACYALDLWQEFYSGSVFFIKETPVIDKFDEPEDDQFELLPDSVIEYLNKERSRWYSTISEHVNKAVVKMGSDHRTRQNKDSSSCKVQDSNLLTLMKHLAKYGLIAVSETAFWSLKDFRKALMDLEALEYEERVVTTSGHSKLLEMKYCKICKICRDLRREIRSMASYFHNGITNCIRGLCLDCTKQGKVHGQIQSCRLADHLEGEYNELSPYKRAWPHDYLDGILWGHMDFS